MVVSFSLIKGIVHFFNIKKYIYKKKCDFLLIYYIKIRTIDEKSKIIRERIGLYYFLINFSLTVHIFPNRFFLMNKT